MSTPDPSDNWTPVGSLSQDTSVYYESGGTWYKGGIIEHFTKLYRNTSVDKSGSEDWAMVQSGWMLPACDNDFEYEEGAANFGTNHVQDWKDSDLSTDHLDHSPRKDKEATFDTSLTAGYGEGQVTIDYTIPYIERDVRYEHDKQIDTNYFYPNKWTGPEAMRNDCNHDQISMWRTSNPSEGDNIAPSFYEGTFGYGGDGGVRATDHLHTWIQWDG